MIVNVSPMTAPPPIPWMPRNAMSWFMPSIGRGRFPAAPHSHDDPMKMARPIRYSHLRPYRSDSFAKTGTAIVEVSR